VQVSPAAERLTSGVEPQARLIAANRHVSQNQLQIGCTPRCPSAARWGGSGLLNIQVASSQA